MNENMTVDDALRVARELLDEPHDVTHPAPRVMTCLVGEVERLRRHLAQHHWNTMGAPPEDCELCAYADRRHEQATTS